MQLVGFVVLALLVTGLLAVAVLRSGRGHAADAQDRAMKVYRDQMAEVDRDLARGTLAPAEADRLRAEIGRRILDLDRDTRPAGQPAPGAMRLVAIAGVICAVVGAGALYWRMGVPGYPDMPLVQRHADAAEVRRTRPRQSELEAEFAAAFPDLPGFEGRDDLEPLVEQLRAELSRRPDDVMGHSLLAQNEARLGNFRDAIAAQDRVIALKGANATTDDLAYLLDLMVIAAGGMVSPEAESVIEQILRRDPNNLVALYFSGRMYAQTGRPDTTFRIWRRLHDLSPGDAPWMPEIRSALPELALISGEPRYQLPPRPAPAGARGPTSEDIDAAQDMAPEARQQMIEGMVEGLLARLGNDGGTAADWAQLLRALGVLGRQEQADAILREAREVFATRPDDMALINDAAAEFGIGTR